MNLLISTILSNNNALSFTGGSITNRPRYGGYGLPRGIRGVSTVRACAATTRCTGEACHRKIRKYIIVKTWGLSLVRTIG